MLVYARVCVRACVRACVCQDDESELPPADRAAGALFERALALATTAKPIRCSQAEPAAAPGPPASAVGDAESESVWRAWIAWTVMRGAEWRAIDRSA
jgi:hypothetical protein